MNIIESDNCNELNYNWIRLLTQDKEQEHKRFEKILDNNDECTIAAIMEFRRLLFQEDVRGKGNAEGYAEVVGNKVKAIEYLEDMFLEPFTNDYFNLCRKLEIKNGWSFDKIVEKHNQYPTKRLAAILTCKCQ